MVTSPTAPIAQAKTVMGNRPNTRTWKSMLNTNPPFRADHVGSILRSAPLKDARAKREKGEITAAQLREVEDREIEQIIAQQERLGLRLTTDGEYRRAWWHVAFLEHLDGAQGYTADHGI